MCIVSIDRPVSIGETSTAHEYFGTFNELSRMQQYDDKFFNETQLPAGK